MATNPPSTLLSANLLARLAEFEQTSGIPAEVVASAAITAALNHHTEYGALPDPMAFTPPVGQPSNIVYLREHIIPPDDNSPPPAVSMARKA